MDTQLRSKEQPTGDISVSFNNMQDIMERHLERLSPLQWTLLAEGLSDSEILGVMTDIITDVFQHYVVKTLRNVIPGIEQSTEAATKTKISEDQINMTLTDLINTEMASILQETPESCKLGEQLNSLIGQEVSHKVSHIVNEIQNTSAYSVEPALYVGHLIPKPSTLNNLVSCVVQCFQRCGGRMKPCFPESCCSVFPKDGAAHASNPETESDPLNKSASQTVAEHFPMCSLSESITEIILQYSEECSPTSSSEDVTDFSAEEHFQTIKAAEEISQIIAEELQNSVSKDSAGQKDGKSFSAPCFPWNRIVGKIRNILSSRLRAAPAEKPENTRKPEFHKFVEQQFQKMMVCLKKPLDLKDVKVIQLNPDIGPTNQKMSLLFPGYLPDLTSNVVYKDTGNFSKLDFQAIRDQIDQLCAEPMEDPFLNERVREFSKELIHKLYSEIMINHFGRIPFPPEGKYLSDSVLSFKNIKDTSGQIKVSPEIFYARVEDEVRMFLHKIFLWLDSEKTQKISEVDRVCSALSDIQDVVGEILGETLQRIQSKESKSPSPRGSTDLPLPDPAIPSQISRSKSPEPPADNCSSLEITSVGSNQSCEGDVSSFASKSDSRILKRKRFSRKKPSKNQFSTSGAECDDEIQSSQVDTNQEVEKVLAFAVMNAVLKCSETRGGPLTSKELTDALTELSGQKVENLSDFLSGENDESIRKIVSAICRHLDTEFGSIDAAFKAMLSQPVCPIQSAVLRCLKSHLPIKSPKCVGLQPFSKMRNVFRNLFRSNKVHPADL